MIFDFKSGSLEHYIRFYLQHKLIAQIQDQLKMRRDEYSTLKPQDIKGQLDLLNDMIFDKIIID